MYLPTPQLTLPSPGLGVDYEEVWIPVQADPGGQLHGWWLPAEAQPGLTFLYLHGNAGNVSTNLDRVLLLRSLGVSVLTIDYRGYGQSSGPFPEESRLYADALAAAQYLATEKGVAPHHLVIYGHSLGGAIGIELASQMPHLAGLVVEGSFTSMADMADLSVYKPWFPVRQLLTQQFNSLARVGSLQVPVLYIHGLADLSVPAWMSQKLYAATPGPKHLWLVPNADHNDLTDWAGAEFEQRLRQFLDHHVLVNP
ncbi:MAG TPA: alpha/beta hydrolase [Leptolyngbyaceae cyanobacterium M65_K2018_010]|nr:alpha/beta hydrolase [Leptolyngbyaceae cyanobacterium M65_K2018_010]